MDEIRKEIRDRITAGGIDPEAVAAAAGMKPEQLQAALEGRRKMTAAQLVDVCQYLGIAPEIPKRPEAGPVNYKNLRKAAGAAGYLLEDVAALIGWDADQLDAFLNLETDLTMQQAFTIQKAIAPGQPIAQLFAV